MRLSYWERENLCKPRNVIIVGAGLVGLSASIEIKRRRPDMSVLVVDKQMIGAAASTRNAGFACFGSVSEIITDVERYGSDLVASLVKRRKNGIARIKSRYSADQIGYVESGGYEIFNTQEEFEKWSAQITTVHKIIGQETFAVCDTPPPLSVYRRSILNNQEGQLNTGQLYSSLLREALEQKVEIRRGISIADADLDNNQLSGIVQDQEIQLHSDLVILASNALTNTYLDNVPVTPVRNQVLITEPMGDHKLRGCFHQEQGYIYFRDVGDRVLIGGGRHLFEEEAVGEFGANQDNLQYLLDHLRRHIFPRRTTDIKISQHWSGILSGGADRLPIVRKLSDTACIAVRLGGMGVAIGMDVGIEVATLALQ